MIDSPSIMLAFAAGFVSFASPCCLPLVPGYLATVSRSDRPPPNGKLDTRLIGRSLLFVGTFSLIFILFGLSATLAGSLLFENQLTLNKFAGLAIVTMGVYFLASLAFPRLNLEWRPKKLIEGAGNGGPVIAGAAFAIAWTPCVGPTLGAILSLASTAQGTGRGGLLLAVYSAGLAVPFLISAIAFSTASNSFDWIKRHHFAIQLISGLTLVAMGVLVLTGELFRMNIEAQRMLENLGLNFFKSV